MSNPKHDLNELKKKIKDIYSKENKEYFEEHVCMISNPNRIQGYHLDLISRFLVLVKYNVEAILIDEVKNAGTCVIVTKSGHIVEIEEEYICKNITN